MLVIHGVFAPCEYKEHSFVDGGILNNVPLNTLQALGEKKMVAIKFAPDLQEKVRNVYDVAFKSIDILFDERDSKTIPENSIMIDVPLTNVKVFDIRKIEYCYQLGYQTMKENMQTIKEYIQ